MKKQNTDKRNQTDEVLKIWKEHVEQHLKTEFPHNESILQFFPEIMPGTGQSIEKLICQKKRLEKLFFWLKNNKAPGLDVITAEVLKAGGEPIVSMLHVIFLKIVNEENSPLHFSKMLVTIFKKEIMHSRKIRNYITPIH